CYDTVSSSIQYVQSSILPQIPQNLRPIQGAPTNGAGVRLRLKNWTPFQIAPPGSASFCSGIAAVSRLPNSKEIWWVGPDGSVQDAHWYDDGRGWRRFPLAPAGSATGWSDIAAVHRVANTMEVWWVGVDESIWGACFDDRGGYCYGGHKNCTPFQFAPA